MQISFATRLPVTATTAEGYVVTLPSGVRRLLLAQDGRILDPAAPAPTGAKIVQVARRFLGLRYLWAGRSGFGFDCSGLTGAILSAYGVTAPRDADAQARAGTGVPLGHLRVGDLLFFGRGHVHHVAIYAGRGSMIESPDSSSAVRVWPLARRHDLVAARRYTR
jgi:cell wall-associated NlpC family hydrolase